MIQSKSLKIALKGVKAITMRANSSFSAHGNIRVTTDSGEVLITSPSTFDIEMERIYDVVSVTAPNTVAAWDIAKAIYKRGDPNKTWDSNGRNTEHPDEYMSDRGYPYYVEVFINDWSVQIWVKEE